MVIERRYSACAKAILVGEHAVVYGASAVAMPIPDMRMELSVKQETRTEQRPLLQMDLGGQPVSPQLVDAAREAAKLLEIQNPGLKISGTSSIPIGAGLGSSAALSVALIRAMAGVHGRDLTVDDESRIANHLERAFHGNPSGLDTSIVANERILEFTRKNGARLIPFSGTWQFALIDSGERSATNAMIEKVSPWFQSPTLGDKRLALFDDIARRAARALTSGATDPGAEEELADAMNHAGRLLGEAGASTDVLDELASIALNSGALAAKPTGAGGGGCLLVLLPDGRAPEICRKLDNHLGARPLWPVTLRN